jgi:hypothetical protein
MKQTLLFIIPNLKMGGLRYRTLEKLAEGHTFGKWPSHKVLHTLKHFLCP